MVSHEDTVEVARTVLAARWGEDVALRLDRVLADEEGVRSVVLRCCCEGVATLPGTVVVKRSRLQQGQLVHEWACLEFLAARPETARLVPHLYGGDREAELLVLEDLGDPDAHLLGPILERHDRNAALAALADLQHGLADLHVATCARRDEFERAVARHGPAGTTSHRVHQIEAALRELPERFAALGVTPGPACIRDVDAAIDEIIAPGPWLTFTHGDATPANTFYEPRRGVRFVDLEAGGYRHALLDGAFARLRYLHSAWAMILPPPLRRRLHDTYREALLSRWPVAVSRDEFDHGLACCALAWLAGLLRWLPSVETGDRMWRRLTVRQRLFAGLEHFADLAVELDRCRAAGEACARAAGHLRRRWPGASGEIPGYPALADGKY